MDIFAPVCPAQLARCEMTGARMRHALDTLDAWTDELARQEAGPTGPYRPLYHRPYMRIVHELRRAEARLADAEAAYRKATSPYLLQQDLVYINRVTNEYLQARRQVE